MAENSKIEWTDHTFNPWIGCAKVSDGCKHCYAENRDKRFHKGIHWGLQGIRTRTSAANWKKPVSWNKKAKELGIRYRVFCASLADVFEAKQNQQGELDNWRSDLGELILNTPNLDWLLLTKRPENVLHLSTYMFDMSNNRLPDNVWIGTSVENQKQADKRIPELVKIPARVRFLSCEPLLGPINLGLMGTCPESWGLGYTPIYTHLHLVIAGGESGHESRTLHPDSARTLRDQCVAADVPFFFKQWGEWLHRSQFESAGFGKFLSIEPDTEWLKVGKDKAGRVLDGRVWNEFPKME